MNRFSVLVIIMLLGVHGNFSQSPKPPNCPSISVAGPSGITEPGEIMTFVAETAGRLPSRLKYHWTVSRLPIINGQGTNKLQVLMDGNATAESTTVTLTIKGLPEGCPNTAYETTATYCPSPPIMLDQLTGGLTEANKENLRLVVVELENNPNDQLYIIETFKKGSSLFLVREKVGEFKRFLIKLRLDEARISFEMAEGPEASTRVYRVPPGAANPTP